ncbi:hypothetical protein GX48_08096 [Paracoccidioides brasiliensis]|nr:hypothetical protein GX48_08096 [Paracoccidioides brasiliensis]
MDNARGQVPSAKRTRFKVANIVSNSNGLKWWHQSVVAPWDWLNALERRTDEAAQFVPVNSWFGQRQLSHPPLFRLSDVHIKETQRNRHSLTSTVINSSSSRRRRSRRSSIRSTVKQQATATVQRSATSTSSFEEGAILTPANFWRK